MGRTLRESEGDKGGGGGKNTARVKGEGEVGEH